MLRYRGLQMWRRAKIRVSHARCRPLSTSRRQALSHDKLAEAQEALVIPSTFPDAPTSRHSDLASFLDHTRRTGLDENSTVYVGTHYEYTVADALSRHGFFLKRIGGASDHGTDLLGTWTLPCLPYPMRVLVQCKAGAQRVGPQHVRELQGAFVGAPAGWRGDGVLGLLVSESSATKGVRDSLGRGRWPMAFVCCSKSGALTQMLWNRRAEDQGLEGLGVTFKYATDQTPELVLTRHGKPLA